ncbi:hypothetical protein LCGC14_2737390, partial [marine sediment metagenome]
QHGDIGDIGLPDLTGTFDFQPLQKIRIFIALGILDSGPGLSVNSLKPHKLI